MTSTSQLTQSLKVAARRLGFELVGTCPAITPIGFHHFSQWLEAGYAGEMHYLEDRKQAYQHPHSVHAETMSLLMLGMNYQSTAPAQTPIGFGRIARYAWGNVDYHDLIHERLRQLKTEALNLFFEAGLTHATARGVVDTAPLLEREFAQLAGLGWAAKNTMLINRDQGSWFFIAALLVNIELEYDEPFTANHCGTCTACLDACPTHAFPTAGVLDATKCISYLTIEHRGAIPVEMRDMMGEWILGCDICQEVCPWNRKAPLSIEEQFNPIEGQNPIELRPLFSLTDEQFRQRFRHTPLWRPKRRGILRNAAMVLGNQPSDENLPALSFGLDDVEPLVRGASAWALGKHRSLSASDSLLQRLVLEQDAEVRAEIQLALALS